ncbi:sensor histidine kinase [Lewinella sp. W8]|uniref:sensor histidine kinase n=1 Tax=Lewinella sp. W8 TaxID=2528208 RepID=UPI00106778B9|nr:sensor histidine kinase [Lewinella sp. W8]MTB51509.1 hypothetical protein [Lewinella sp. W8]
MDRSLFTNYPAIVLGGVITAGLGLLFYAADWIILAPGLLYVTGNVVSVILSWLIIAWLLHSFSTPKVVAVFALLYVAMLGEIYFRTPSNPVSVPLIILFWLGVASLILPQFFKKYRFAIFLIYGGCLLYYLIVRVRPDFLEHYNQDFLKLIIVPIPVFALLWLYEQWRWVRTLEADKDKAELALLKSQINPHFFFNTLNNLYGLVVEQSAQAPGVILKLSDMMRYTIYEGKEDDVLLTEEISYLESYIELHRIRYERKVDIQFHHEVAKDVRVAPLLFIILLENAFKHGVNSLSGGAFIHLHLVASAQSVHFSIKNNYAPSVAQPGGGIGIDNLRKRLAFTYPNRHDLRIERKGQLHTVQLKLQLI